MKSGQIVQLELRNNTWAYAEKLVKSSVSEKCYMDSDSFLWTYVWVQVRSPIKESARQATIFTERMYEKNFGYRF